MSTRSLVLPITLGLTTVLGSCQPPTEAQAPQSGSSQAEYQSRNAVRQYDNDDRDDDRRDDDRDDRDDRRDDRDDD